MTKPYPFCHGVEANDGESIPESEITSTAKCTECGMLGGSRKSPGAVNFILQPDSTFLCWICAHPAAERCEDHA